MGNLWFIILVAIFFGGGDCKMKQNGESISDAGEKCSKGTSWAESSSAFVLGMMEGKSNDIVEPKFLCFSRESGQAPSRVTNANFSAWDADGRHFDPAVKTVFIIHGFKDTGDPWTWEMKDALLLREDCNVFIVEHGEPSEKYSDVVRNIPEVGKKVALFIHNLLKSKRLDLQRVHIIGFSAGAQVAGFAGKEIYRTTKRSVARITGLDPAGPGFYDAPPDRRLDATDASFVDIIHTNSGCSRIEGYGYPYAIGHFDFYPNGGRMQPGCLTMSQYFGKRDPALANIMFKYLFGTLEQLEKETFTLLLCSHPMSRIFFKASILNEGCQFRSVQCSSWERYASGQCDGNKEVAMGYYADRYRNYADDGAKKFYLSTSDHPPFC